MNRVGAAILYFLMVYAAGFSFGTIREFLLTPFLGLTRGILIEAPFLIITSFYAALLVLRRTPPSAAAGYFLSVGAIALTLLLIAEEAMSWTLRGMSVFSLWARMPLLAAQANYVTMVFFLLMPFLVGKSEYRHPRTVKK